MGCNAEQKSKILTIIYQKRKSHEKISEITKISIEDVKACGNMLKEEKLIEECCGKYSTASIVGTRAEYTSGDDSCSGAG